MQLRVLYTAPLDRVDFAPHSFNQLIMETHISHTTYDISDYCGEHDRDDS